MKHILFALLLAIGVVSGGAVFAQSMETQTVQADLVSQGVSESEAAQIDAEVKSMIAEGDDAKAVGNVVSQAAAAARQAGLSGTALAEKVREAVRTRKQERAQSKAQKKIEKKQGQDSGAASGSSAGSSSGSKSKGKAKGKGKGK